MDDHDFLKGSPGRHLLERAEKQVDIVPPRDQRHRDLIPYQPGFGCGLHLLNVSVARESGRLPRRQILPGVDQDVLVCSIDLERSRRTS